MRISPPPALSPGSSAALSAEPRPVDGSPQRPPAPQQAPFARRRRLHGADTRPETKTDEGITEKHHAELGQCRCRLVDQRGGQRRAAAAARHAQRYDTQTWA
jgi:hypothetical protein